MLNNIIHNLRQRGLQFGATLKQKLSILVFVINLLGTHVYSQTPISLAEGSAPSFSPDGRQIAFEHERQIWSIFLKHGIFKKISTLRWDFAPMWSPNGKEIVFQSYGNPDEVWKGRFSIWIIDTNRAKPHELIKPFPGENDQYPRWSPDGRSIVWTHGKQLWIVDRDGKNARPLTSRPAKQYELIGDWSPDGKSIAYLACESYSEYPNYKIWLIDSTGGNQRILSIGIRAYALRWSRADNYIYYSTGKELWKIHSDGIGDSEKVLTFFDPMGNTIDEFDISLDGRRLVYADPGDHWEGRVYLIKLK